MRGLTTLLSMPQSLVSALGRVDQLFLKIWAQKNHASFGGESVVLLFVSMCGVEVLRLRFKMLLRFAKYTPG